MTFRAYQNPRTPKSKNSMNPPCELCHGEFWLLRELDGRIVAFRCSCLLPKQKVTVVHDFKSRAAGDVA